MPSFLDFIPAFATETIDRIRARLNADVNAGVAPTDSSFQDTTPGGFFWDITQTAGLEIERLWDAMGTELIAAVFPSFAWGAYLDEHGVTVGLERKPAVVATGTVTFTGKPGTLVAAGTQVAVAQVDATVDPVFFETVAAGTVPAGGSIDIPVQAVFTGPRGNIPAGQVSVLGSEIPDISSVNNAAPISGGATVESDENFRDRVLLAFTGAHGAGTAADYEQWALAYPGVGYAKVTPLWNGPGTVKVTITDQDNNPSSAATVAGLQAQLDPVPGQGQGLAPIGAIVTVATPMLVIVNVAGSVVLDSGYTLDGTGGSVAVRGDIDANVRDYIDRLRPGDSVIRENVIARFFDVPGVHDVTALTLNGAGGNFTVTSGQVVQMGTLVL